MQEFKIKEKMINMIEDEYGEHYNNDDEDDSAEIKDD